MALLDQPYSANQASPGVSQQPLTDLSFIATGASWPPPSQRERLRRYHQNRQLWRGQHDAVYGNWWRVLREDKQASLEIVFNWHKRISTLWADLLLSEPPRFLAGDSTPAQDALDRISGKTNNGYVSTLYEVALDVSRYGDGVVKVTLEEDGARIWCQPPTYWFPVVAPDNLRKVTDHVLAWTISRGDTTYIWFEVHGRNPGFVSRVVFNLDGNTIGNIQPLADFTDLAGYEETLIDDFLIVPFPGLRASDDIFGMDDYGDLDSIVAAIEVRAGQINRVLDKHTDPSMYGPTDNLEVDQFGNTVFRAAGRYFEVDEDDVPPGYVTWDGQLEAQFKELEFLIEQLYVISETSPAAFGQLKAGLAESGSALKRLMQAPLAKVARMTMRFDPAARAALKIAAALERAHGRQTPALDDIQIQWQDGLPADALEQAQTEQIRTRSHTSSLVSSIRRLDGGTQRDAEDELARILAQAEPTAEPTTTQNRPNGQGE